jgi:predicted aconitase with swiveling domain
MTDYTHVLSDTSIPGADPSFGSYEILSDATFMWPYNYFGDGPTISKILELTPSPGVSITLPSAMEVSKGEAFLIRNIGINDLALKKGDGTSLSTVSAGSVVYLYLTDTSTSGGVWGIVNFGVGTSLADASSLSGYGLTTIGSVLNSALPTEVQSSSWTVDEYDRAKAFIYTGGTGTLTLPVSMVVGDDFFVMLRNSGTGTLTIDPSSTETIDDQLTLAINPGESLILICDGSEWYTVGYGRSMLYQFTQLTKDISAGGTITLTAEEAGNKLLKFTGSPSSTVIVVVPSVTAVYYIYNSLSTPQMIRVKSSSVAYSDINQGQRAIIFCDGVDVLAAQTAALTGDVSLTNGSAAAPSMKFATSTNTGLHKYSSTGLGFSVEGSLVGFFSTSGFSVPTGYLQIPSVTTPAQIAEGALVWDSDSDLLTIGDGSGRKTMVDLTTAQTLTNKTLTSPVVNGGIWTVPSGSGSTTEGVVQWNISSNVLTIGDGAATKTFVDLTTAQTLTNKTLTSPVVNGGVWTVPSGSGSTTEGVVQWNTSSNVLTIGDGAATKTFVDTNSTQTLTNKTLTSPTITSSTINSSTINSSTINSSTINSSTINSPTLTGFAGTVTPLTVSGGLTSNTAYSYSASGLTLTLPASPVNGDLIMIVNTSTQVDCIIARNTGKTIMGLTENLTFDKANSSITLKCINGTDWRII